MKTKVFFHLNIGPQKWVCILNRSMLYAAKDGKSLRRVGLNSFSGNPLNFILN